MKCFDGEIKMVSQLLLSNWKTWISWGSLRAIHNSKFISSMYVWLFFVPVIKKFLSKINEPFEFSFVGANRIYELDLQSPFSWDMFFYSALFFVMGNIVFVLAAPKLIKYFKDYGEYFGSNKNITQLKYFVPDNLNNINWDNLEISSNTDQGADLFWIIFGKLNETYRYARIACFIFYCIGFLLFGIVVLKNILWVITYSNS